MIGSCICKTVISLPAQRLAQLFYFFFFWAHHYFGYLHGYSEAYHEGTDFEPGEAIILPLRGQFSKSSQRGAQIANHCRSIYEFGEVFNF